jgi:hypothetical protein
MPSRLALGLCEENNTLSGPAENPLSVSLVQNYALRFRSMTLRISTTERITTLLILAFITFFSNFGVL